MRLRKLIIKSPEYREKKDISKEKAKASITEDLNDCIDTRCHKDVVDKSILTAWTYNVKSVQCCSRGVKSKALVINGQLNVGV